MFNTNRGLINWNLLAVGQSIGTILTVNAQPPMFHFADHAADLGFVLHGGIDSPCIHGDPGIFIKHVITGSLVDRKLRAGDRILSVS